MMKIQLSIVLLLCSACEAGPDPCARMCRAAATIQGECLDEQGLDWNAAGYADRDSFVESCETWAWEMRLLEEDAIRRGALREEKAGVTERVCEQRADRLSAEDAGCESFADIDWNALPWR